MALTTIKILRKHLQFACTIFLFFFVPCCIWCPPYPKNPVQYSKKEDLIGWKVEAGYLFEVIDPLDWWGHNYTHIYNLILYKKDNREWKRYMTLENISLLHGNLYHPLPSFNNMNWIKDNYLFVNARSLSV